MNSKTAKLLNRYAAVNRFSNRVMKRVWNSMPRQKRHEHRMELKRLIAADK